MTTKEKKTDAMLMLIKHLHEDIKKIDRQVERYGDKAGHLWHIKDAVEKIIQWAELFKARQNKEDK